MRRDRPIVHIHRGLGGIGWWRWWRRWRRIAVIIIYYYNILMCAHICTYIVHAKLVVQCIICYNIYIYIYALTRWALCVHKRTYYILLYCMYVKNAGPPRRVQKQPFSNVSPRAAKNEYYNNNNNIKKISKYKKRRPFFLSFFLFVLPLLILPP